MTLTTFLLIVLGCLTGIVIVGYFGIAWTMEYFDHD